MGEEAVPAGSDEGPGSIPEPPSAVWSGGGLSAREATPDELADWDRQTVEPPTGNALQSRAWGTYRSHFGWQPVYLVLSDGARVLGLRRSGHRLRPDRVYLSRGPIPDDAAVTARRLQACAAWCASHGVGVLISDSEMPADTGYGRLIRAFGSRPTEEVQPSRHRLALHLRVPGIAVAEDLLASFSATTRNLIRSAERSDLRVEVHESATPDAMRRLPRFHALVEQAGRRKQFGVASRRRFLDWSGEAMQAGIQVFIEAIDDRDRLVAGATFYRHGDRWTYALAADDPRFRKAYPGAVRLVMWVAIQRALSEGRAEMDLGGVDVPGARRKPLPDEPEHGMLAFKESFDARWVELAGAHSLRLPAADVSLLGVARRLRRSVRGMSGAVRRS